MNSCPACSKPIGADDLACPHCKIRLNPGTANEGPASGGGKTLSVAAIVVIAVAGIVLLLGCLGMLGAWVFAIRSAAPLVAPASVKMAAPSLPAPITEIPAEPEQVVPETVPDEE